MLTHKSKNDKNIEINETDTNVDENKKTGLNNRNKNY
jgi:hypothetical protein